MIVYFETSSFVKLFVEEHGSAAAIALWKEADAITSSAVTYAETRAALAAARRGGRLTPGGFVDAKGRLEVHWDQITDVAVRAEIVRRAGDLAERHALRGYDALHLSSALAVAGDEGFALVTSDADLARAATRVGLQVASLT